MPILSDIEIIKSAIIYGDLDDAMSVIRSRKKSLAYRLKHNPTEKTREYSRFLESLDELLRGNLSLDGFREAMGELPNMQAAMDITGDNTGMMDSLYYLLEYSLDRYNIRYPAFDGKRCDDK